MQPQMQPMNADTITLAPAGPGEAELAAALIYDTGAHVFNCLYDRDLDSFHRITAAMWSGTTGAFSHVHAVAALQDSRLAGIELGLSGDRYGTEMMAVGGLIAERAGPALLAHLASVQPYISWMFPEVPEDAYYLLFLSAHRDGRGRGIGARLLTQCFDKAARLGLSAVHLDVASDNPAVRFYERMGMERLVESRVPRIVESHGVPAHFRMVKRL